MTGEESVRSVPESGRRGRWGRRLDDDDDDGPFLPPEPAAESPAAGQPAAGQFRPRPRPAVAATAPVAKPEPAPEPTPEPAQSSASRPRPRPRPAAAPASGGAADGATEHRNPDISRFLQADAPAEPDPSARTGRSAAKHGVAAAPDKPRRSRPKLSFPKLSRPKLSSRGVRFASKLVVALVIAAAAALVLRAYVVAPFYIPSQSMEPTLTGGGGATDDRILVDKITYHIHDPHEGDIVVFNRPDTWTGITDKTLVKRIIGLPGDIVSLRHGLVYVNGLRLTENYVNKACGSAPTNPLIAGKSQWRVPMDDYFVMGDNRCNSDDSRHYGPVPRSKIVGRVFVIVWPLSRFGTP